MSLIRKLYSYIVVNNLWLALEWCIPMLWLVFHVFDVVFHTKWDDMSSTQASNQEDRFHC